MLKVLFSASPFLFSSSGKRKTRSQIEWIQPVDDWNITAVPRSVYPHLENKNQKHNVPGAAIPRLRTIDGDEKMMQRFLEIKVSCYSMILCNGLTNLYVLEQ